MSGVEFDPGKRKLLFFTRGRGRGHAIPDIEIVRRLETLREDVDVRFVSYSTGAETLAEFGYKVIDLSLPELNSLLDTVVLSTKVVEWLNPDLVVAHEEFGALPAAKVHDKPTIFITDWFVGPERIIMDALCFADQVLFLDEEGFFEEPPQVQGRVTYVGPVFRRFDYTLDDRQRARRELRLPENATVISVLPGSFATEEIAPIADLVLESFDRLPRPEKRLVWIAGSDVQLLEKKFGSHPGVTIKAHDWQIDRIMVASDVAITKANRKTVIELEYLAVPSIALSSGLNPIDDARAQKTAGATFLRLAEVGAETLVAEIERAIGRELSPAHRNDSLNGAEGAARCLAAALSDEPG